MEDEGVLETFMVVARESEDIVFGYTMDAGAAAAKGLARSAPIYGPWFTVILRSCSIDPHTS